MRMVKNENRIHRHQINPIAVMEHILNPLRELVVKINPTKVFTKNHNDSMWQRNRARFYLHKSKKTAEEKN